MPKKCLLQNSRKKKSLSRQQKTRRSKSRKIDIFPKGLTHAFIPKMAIFPTFIFQEIQARKCFLRYSRTKKRLPRLYNQEVQKVEEVDIFPKGLRNVFGRKMTIFPTFIFLGYVGQENVFYDILERKNAVVAYKNKKLEKSKNRHFSKGVNPCFQSKNGHFSNIYFQKIQARKMSFTKFQKEKTPFQII